MSMKKIQVGHHRARKQYIHPMKYALVDNEDYEELSKYKWFLVLGKNGNYYTARTRRIDGKTHSILMTRMIMKPTRNQVVDHINHNTLDNRRANLRVCATAGNAKNRQINIKSRTGYKGVGYHKASKLYRARINKDGKSHHLGLFREPTEAAKAYNKAAKELHGEFALLNKI